MPTTEDPNDPLLSKSGDPPQIGDTYLVLSEEEKGRGYVRPVRTTYRHRCGKVTHLNLNIAETFARDPHFYTVTCCVECRRYDPLDEFTWLDDGTRVGT